LLTIFNQTNKRH